MATTTFNKDWVYSRGDSDVTSWSLTGITVVLGRVLFSVIFILSGFGHFSSQTVAYASQMGLGGASFIVPLSGALIIAGGLSITFGFYARFGAAALIIFLIPTTFIMHRFWGIEDPLIAMNQQAHFMKNLSMIGAALLICHFGAGPLSLDSRRVDGPKENLNH
jgi:putative oxidoreductase